MPPKHKGESKTKCDKSCCTDSHTSSVFFLNDEEGTDELDMVKLKHPGTDKPAYFVFSKENKKVYELFTFTETYRSYFIEEIVKSDGRLFVTTPIDPLFLALPYLASSVHCSPLDQILRDDEFPNVERLSEMPSLEKNITKIADKKGTTVFGYKFNEEKALIWLESKVERTVAALRQHSVQVSSSTTVISNNFVKHSSESQEAKDNYLKYGFGIVSEYLSVDLRLKLQEKLKITLDNEQSASKRNRSASRDQDVKETKKPKLSKNSADNSENSPPKPKGETPKAKTPTQSAKDKARAKAASGSKNISSFFKKSTA